MNDAPPNASRMLLNVTLAVFLVAVGVYVLINARGFLIPLVLAGIAFYLVNLLDRLWGRTWLLGRRLPRLAATLLSGIIILLTLRGAVLLIADNAEQVARELPRYEDRLVVLYDKAIDDFGHVLTFWAPEPDEPAATPEPTAQPEAEADDPAADDASVVASGVPPPGKDAEPARPEPRLIDFVDPASLFNRLAASTAAVVGNGLLVAAYLFFLVLERSSFDTKLLRMIPDDDRRAAFLRVLREVDHDVGVYLGVKIFVSLLTAVPSYLIMAWVGLDFAGFWGLLIFVLNFIPNLGSLIATAFPTLLAFVQFGTEDQLFSWQFFAVGGGVTAIQLIVANLVEPQMMGRTLNMSRWWWWWRWCCGR